MSRRSRIVALAFVGLATGVWLCAWGAGGTSGSGGHEASSGSSRAASTAREALARTAAKAPLPAVHDGLVRISGSVIDEISRAPVADVEVVFRSSLGESTTTATSDGTYSIEIAPGEYRAFVRDDNMISVGLADQIRLPVGPRAETAGAPDEALMPLVVASADTDHVELGVLHGGSITGRVEDRSGRAIAHAIIRARGSEQRPALGTDIAESDADGNFELHVPTGRYVLDATHAIFAGLLEPEALEVEPGAKIETTVTMTSGCIITGRVVRPDGTVASDGAIERQVGDLQTDLAPAGRIEPDGTFRWTSIEETEVTLRAWPWKSPPSQFRTFRCYDGARIPNVVFRLERGTPTVEGTLVDASGAPVAFAYIDLQPLDPGSFGQQERTDAEGRWQGFEMPPGRYQAQVQVPGRGVLNTMFTTPGDPVQLQLGGVGRIEGTTTDLVDGSFALTFEGCSGIASIAHEPRIVTVTGGRFEIDDAPACELQMVAIWHGRRTEISADVSASDTTQIEVDIGPPRERTIHGTVTDRESRPITGAVVRISGGNDGSPRVVTDSVGRYTMQAPSGAHLVASDGDVAGYAMVGRANVADEQVDIVVDAADY